MYTILILGSGGREHAFIHSLHKSPLCQKIFIAPGNGGTDDFAENVALDIKNFESVAQFVLGNKVDIVVVGPEAPLVEGIVDYFRSEKLKHIKVVGPDAFAAQLEGSKAFAKKFMQKYNIPTAGYLEVSSGNIEEGYHFLDKLSPPYVLKADGLAAGKGVLILNELSEAKEELSLMLSGKFGDASSKVVIEEFLDGIEFSVFALTDGRNYALLPQAKDYKRIGEGDTGLNTGGMGAVSPVPFVTDELLDDVIKSIIDPTIQGIGLEKMSYKGFVFFGLILVKGKPYVIEYNCRMGDPETEVVLPRLDEDLLSLFLSLFDNSLETHICQEIPGFATTVMLVSGGYPGDYEKGKKISLSDHSEGTIFHAGTKKSEGLLKTEGGRVLVVTSLAPTMDQALKASIGTAEKIHFDGKYFRRDIGVDLKEK